MKLTQERPRGCEQLGGVITRNVSIGKGTNPARRLFIELRNAAGERKADYFYLQDAVNTARQNDQPQVSAAGLTMLAVLAAPGQTVALQPGQGALGSTAGRGIGRGIAYRCGSSADRKRRLEAALKRSPSRAEGFALHAPMKEGQAVCTSHGGRWTEGTTAAVCDISASKFVRLYPCAKLVCKIEVVESSDVDDDAAWAAVLRGAHTEMTKQFGIATQQARVPDICRRRLLECTASGQLDLLEAWRWIDGSSVEYHATTLGGRPATRKLYRRAKPPR